MSKKIDEPKFSTISLPTKLVEKIKKQIEGTGIHSPSAYVTFVLREILSEDSENKEKDSVKNRLKNLGYL